jgi:hypothetical protein
MSISNLFVFPTKNETFGFTLAEAALSGQLLVLNSSLPMQYEIAGSQQLFVPVGSHNNSVKIKDGSGEAEDEFYRDIAKRICAEFDANPVLQAKMRFRRLYNRNAVWRKLEQAIAAVLPLEVAA